ncbi:septal ring lytic transglycosylase RlpA family protein [Adhaeribacter sp. BT258]|uniref:Probable endolytic peptidoglycan transglycosylase RlpA n=1 Tax=Adhaeribacter terrigena TaxID=2793070 RepID=A0ABS1C2M2_9BACT|nr:septal ring lytic transglycosylase RlpA family protein [Adhaeribacter terrigena]MBK0403651.1 septal ring lytic transglycosylase RlpA family protein [Adhaeribacter terrigena]
MHFIRSFFYAAACFLMFLLAGCASTYTETGKASFYSSKLEGRKMANGDKYRPGKLTAAHKTLPFGTRLKVTNLDTKKSVKVKVTDRGPFSPGRVVDLSYKAADKVDMIKAGVAPVKIKVIGKKKES